MATVPSITEFYQDKSVFITGATGFMGKALLEKLLRSCPGIRRVYILIRPKKGKEVSQRLEELLNSKIFDHVSKEQPNYRDKVYPVTGDILHDNLGVCESDEKCLIQDVSLVFHSAATVKFDELMKLSVEMNVVGVSRMITFCKKLQNLKALIHVSTAYANCNQPKNIEEKIYEPPLHPHKILDAVDWMDTDILNALTPKMIGDRPNTYTYTKSIAEYLVKEECADIPTAIFRPSIVGATWDDPVPGWVDNYNGPTGLLAAIGCGLLRIMKGDFHATADIIPVDFTAKMMIATAWYTVVHKPENLSVYHCTTGQINRFTWGQMERMSYSFMMKNPVNTVARVPNPRFTKNAIWHDLNVVFDHLIPAYLMDFYMWISGKRPIFVKIQERLRKSVASLDYFTSQEWNFNNAGLYKILEVMTPEDKKDFNFDPKMINWAEYMEAYCLGTKRFVMKEELEELPKARNTLKKLQRINMASNVILIIVIWRLLYNRVPIAKSLWNFLIGWAIKIFRRLPAMIKSS
ncbi:fatty acyl-CoA reductase 1-like [Ylistrum balloti]|uniref:fatty acyl-CoA reductase 1-like n=1 Tax=Ylistrum balloti TaxID=509963 RepID=UPI00290586F0|nr:fatty acyl-CoA reductase 1-like [Ylistrum balloti]